MDGREIASRDMHRAAARLRLAGRALSAATRDLRLAQRRDAAGITMSVEGLEAEIELVCDMAEQISEAAESLRSRRPSVGDASRPEGAG